MSNSAGITPLRVLVADDQPVIRRGLALILGAEDDLEIVGQAPDGDAAVELARELEPDVVVMDLQMPGRGGVSATREIAGWGTRTRVVVLTTYAEDDLVFEAVRAGAQAYLLKDAAEEELLDTVRGVAHGESRLSPVIARKVMERFRELETEASLGAAASAPEARPAPPPSPTNPSPAAHERLSAKEERVLGLLADGLTNRDIAATIHLAEGTVKNHVSRIMHKLHARSRTELAVRALRRGNRR